MMDLPETQMTPGNKLELQYNRLIEYLYACARQYGEELNLEVAAKYLEETRGKNILIEWNYLGNPETPDDGDTLVASFFLEDLGVGS